MSWNLVDSGSTQFADGNAGHAYSFPGGAASSGDLLLVAIGSNTVVSTPSGYAADVSDVNASGTYIFRKVAAGGETGVTVTTSGDHPTALGFLRYTGGASTPFDVSAHAFASGAGTSSPSVTTATLATTGELSVAAMCGADLIGVNPNTPVWSTGYTGLLSQATAGNTADDQILFVAANTNAGTAAESPSVTWTASVPNRAIVVATYKPGTAAPVLATMAIVAPPSAVTRASTW